MDNPEVVLEVRDLVKRFDGLVAVDHLNFKVRRGKIHALIGPNGAGKTTTVNMITGENPQTEGDVLFEGKSISGRPVYARAQMGIGRTFQNIKLFSAMTVTENLMIGGQSKTTQSLLKYLADFRSARKEERHLREKAKEVLNFIGMYQYRDEIVNNLAYGRQKMTELGRTLMGEPKLILLDEPAAGMNSKEKEELNALLYRIIDRGVSILIIEHDMKLMMGVADYLYVLNYGKLLAQGTAAEVQANPQVVKAYLGGDE